MDPNKTMENSTSPNSYYQAAVESDTAISIMVIILLVFMTVAGTFGNGLVIAAVALHKNLQTSCNVFVVNLAIADLCVTCVINPFNIIGILYGSKYFGHNQAVCDVVATICIVSCSCSLFNILAVSFNRFIAILHNKIYDTIFSIRKSILVAIFLWVLAAVVQSPTHYGWGGNWFDEKQLVCIYDRTDDYSYTIFIALFDIFVPVTLVFGFYAAIFHHVWRARATAKSGSTPSRGDEKRSREKTRNVKLAKSLFLIFVAFVICWSPWALVILLDKDDEWPPVIHSTSVLMAHIGSSGLNSLIYALTQPPFRSAYLSILHCKKHSASTSTTVGGTSTVAERIIQVASRHS